MSASPLSCLSVSPTGKESAALRTPSFSSFCETHGHSVEVLAAARRLASVITSGDSSTMAELVGKLTAETEAVERETRSLTMQSLCQLFMGILSQPDGDERSDWEVQRLALARSADRFIHRIQLSQGRVARNASNFIRDNAKVLIHGTSRVVLAVLVHALSTRKRFSLYVTQGSPAESTEKYVESLAQFGLHPTVVPDSAVAYHMGQMDLVFCGAAAIAENGGVVNQIGTYQIALVAAAHSKPFYVVAESFKFARALFPLKQTDIPRFNIAHPPFAAHYQALSLLPKTHIEHSFFDLTPPKYITFLITDLGVIPPSAVSDELMKLEQRLVN